MRLGLDLDNTIVSYDQLFYQVAIDSELVPKSISHTKVAVRDYLRNADKEDKWTELQGVVYGSRMIDASPFPGALETIRKIRDKGIEVFIISHRTRFPYLGPKVNLHDAAKDWINTILRDDAGAIVEGANIFFHEKKEDKVDRIGSVDCDAFVDDLPEILMSERFPEKTHKILFDPAGNVQVSDHYTVLNRWEYLTDLLLNRFQQKQGVPA